MTFPRLHAMLDYWDRTPPLTFALNEIRLILRAYFGVKSDGRKRNITEQKQSRKEFETNFAALAGIMNG